MLSENTRVRVGAIEEDTNWWFATVKSANRSTVTVQLHCAGEPETRSYPVRQVQELNKDTMGRDWMLGMRVPVICKRNKSHKSGIVASVNDAVLIEYPSNLKQKNAFWALIEFLYEQAASYGVDDMPWNNIEPYDGPPIPYKTEICKEFNVGWFYGYVDEGPSYRVEVDNGKLLERGYYFHILYTDGDQEWMSPSDIATHGEYARVQRAKDAKRPALKEKKVSAAAKPKAKRRGTKRHVVDDEQDSDADADYCSKGDENAPQKRAREKSSRSTNLDTTMCPLEVDVTKRPARGAAARKRKQGEQYDSESEDEEEQDVTAVREPDTKPAPVEREEDPVWGHKELNSSLSVHYERCFRLKEFSVGVAGFHRMFNFHKMHMNGESRKKMIDLLVFGPLAPDQTTRFPDKFRTVAGTKTVKEQLKISGMHDLFAVDLAASEWEQCLTQMTKPLFAAEGDEQRTTHDALLRVGESLFVKAHCMEFFADILEHEQQRCAPSSEAISKKELLAAIACSRMGGKGALDLAVKAYLYLLVNHGPFLSVSTRHLCHEEGGPQGDCLETVIDAAAKLNKALGRVVSIMAWLYAITEHENVFGVSHLIGSMVSNEIENATFDPTPFMDGTAPRGKKYWKRIKLNFIVGLNRSVVPQLRPHLAEKLSVATAYNRIFR